MKDGVQYSNNDSLSNNVLFQLIKVIPWQWMMSVIPACVTQTALMEIKITAIIWNNKWPTSAIMQACVRDNEFIDQFS